VPLPTNLNAGEFHDRRTKDPILFPAALLCARKLTALDSDRPSPAKLAAVETAIDQAKFILDRIHA
jgi:hypothetical protein